MMADSTHASTDINVHPDEVLDTIRKFMLVDGFPIVDQTDEYWETSE